MPKLPKSNLIVILLLTIFVIPVNTQNFDPSMLENLSPEQIKKAQDLVSGKGMKLNPFSETNKSEESLNIGLNGNNESLIQKAKTNTFDLEDCIYDAVSENELMLCNKKEESQTKINDNKKFGYDFFNHLPTSISATGDLPLPNDYKISLKDQFTISLSGSKDYIIDASVMLDGTILLPEIGSLSVIGDTFESAKAKITNLFNKSYIGVNVDIAIKNISAKKVSIVGAVKTPGTYLLNPFTTISGALAYSGGVQEIGSLRNIKLIKTSGKIFYFDLYDLLIHGDRSNDYALDAGDTILVDSANNFVKLNGSVNRPMVYEILKSDKLEDIIDYGLGFKNTSNKSNILLSVLNLENSSIDTMQVSDMSTSLKDVISVSIFDYINENRSGIQVYGAVQEPGNYSLNKFKNLENLINSMNFIDVYPYLAVLEKFDRKSLKRETILFNLNDKSTFKNILLTENSKIYFLGIDSPERYLLPKKPDLELVQTEDISLQKEDISLKVIPVLLDTKMLDASKLLVNSFSLSLQHKDGNYLMPVFGSYSIMDFVNYLGLDMSLSSPIATFISASEEEVMQMDYQDMNFETNKFQTVLFKNTLNDLISVEVAGAVNYPSIYTLRPGTSIEQLYSQIGGFKMEANLDAVVYKRLSLIKSQKEVIEKSKNDINNLILNSNLAEKAEGIDPSIMSALNTEIDENSLGRISGNFRPNSDGATRTILRDGDSLFIPISSNTITVFGEVLNPTSFTFLNGLTIDEAIRQAGGFKKTADKGAIYVIHSNGLVEKKSRNLFSGTNNLKPGDTIVVPRNLSSRNATINYIGSITKVLSDLAFSAAALDNLQSN